MAELVPLPLPLLLGRVFLNTSGKARSSTSPRASSSAAFRASISRSIFTGHRAATPLGPAAGPHANMAQNIVLSWLGGSRIIELKTVQILDELKIPRPCIDIANVGYNVEMVAGAQARTSLREYVGAVMLIEIVKAFEAAGEEFFAGRNGLRHERGYTWREFARRACASWIESMEGLERGRRRVARRADQLSRICRSPRASATPSASRRFMAVRRARLRHSDLPAERSGLQRLHQDEPHAAGRGRGGHTCCTM